MVDVRHGGNIAGGATTDGVGVAGSNAPVGVSGGGEEAASVRRAVPPKAAWAAALGEAPEAKATVMQAAEAAAISFQI